MTSHSDFQEKLASLSGNPVAPAQKKASPQKAANSVAIAAKASLKPLGTAKTAPVAKSGAGTKSRSQSRHSILLNKQDTAIIRRVRMALLADGHDNVNMSRILRMGLRLLPEEDSVLLKSYQGVSAEDMRLKR